MSTLTIIQEHKHPRHTTYVAHTGVGTFKQDDLLASVILTRTGKYAGTWKLHQGDSDEWYVSREAAEAKARNRFSLDIR